jgi:hypothetical protein
MLNLNNENNLNSFVQIQKIINANINKNNKNDKIINEKNNNIILNNKKILLNKIQESNKKIENLNKSYYEKINKLNTVKLNKLKEINKNKIENIKKEYFLLNSKILKTKENLKKRLNNTENSFILIKEHKQKIENENLTFKNIKLLLLDKLIEYQKILNNINSNNSSKIIKTFSN